MRLSNAKTLLPTGNHSTTTTVKGQTFQDWFIHDYILNEVGMSPLVSGFFWECVTLPLPARAKPTEACIRGVF